MIQKLLLYPPLGFARVGPSETPCDSFYCGPNDLRPRGTGKTTILPAETLHISADGTVSLSLPTKITFKDAAGFRPVCPFFELHGEWMTADGTAESGPITPQVLGMFGLTARDLTWEVEVANLKAFHYTLVPDDRIVATVELSGRNAGWISCVPAMQTACANRRWCCGSAGVSGSSASGTQRFCCEVCGADALCQHASSSLQCRV
jgi:hypothetical protein